MNKLFTFASWLLGICAMAQERVTDFENVAIKSPNQVQKIDTVNGKLLFLANMPENEGVKLWVTDGTPQNTRVLTDSEGLIADRGENALKAYGFVYLKAKYLYRTNGDSLQRIALNTDTLGRLQYFNNKILLNISRTNYNGTYYENHSYLSWLNDDNTFTTLDTNVVLFKIIDSTLHYLRFDYQTKLYELCKLTKDGKLSRNSITTSGLEIGNFEYLSRGDTDYYFFDTKGRKILIKPANSIEPVALTDWGGNSLYPFFLKDNKQNIYVFKHFGSLTVYEFSADNQLHEKWFVPLETVYKITMGFTDNFTSFGAMQIHDDKLFFKAMVMGESLHQFYLIVHDFKTNITHRSQNLLEYFRFYYYSATVKPLGSDRYLLDNGYNKRLIYDSPKDSILQVIDYVYQDPSLADSLLTLNKRTLVLSGSIYALNNGVKTPLINIKALFDPGINDFFIHRILGDKILFWRYNSVTKQNELWVSKGEAGDAEKLMSAEEYFFYNSDQIVEQNGKVYFYTLSTAGVVQIYQTDGTKEGTHPIVQHNMGEDLRIDEVKSNDTQIIYIAYASSIGRCIIVVEKSEAKLIEVNNYYDTYLTKNNVYIRATKGGGNELLKVENGGLKLIDRDALSIRVYQHSLFYSKEIMQTLTLGLFTLNAADEPTQYITENIRSFGIYGNKLVYLQYIGTEWFWSVIDLTANKLEIKQLKLDITTPLLEINDALILTTPTKILIIKGAEIKEHQLLIDTRNEVFVFNKGFLIMGNKNLSYYDLAEDKVSVIVSNRLLDRSWLTEQIKQNNEFLLIPFESDEFNEKRKWAFWSIPEKKLIMLPDTIYYFNNMHSLGGIAYNRNMQHMAFWRYTNGQFIKAYNLPAFSQEKIYKLGNNLYASFYTAEKGYELYQLAPDALLAFPEVIPGSEGMWPTYLFEFKGNVYIYGFTYTYGWQVWRMSGEKKIISQPEPPLSAEPTVDGLFAYPNPAKEMLYINTEKALLYKMINTKGQVLMQGEIAPRQGISIQQLPQSAYLLQLFDGNRTYVKKVIKN